MKICMIGTGYVGLVSGVCFADLGNNVICVDKDINKINNLKVDEDLPVSKINLQNKNFFKLSIGKKKHFKIIL